MKFKILHIYIIDAKGRDEAIEKFAVAKRVGKTDDYFETEIVKKIDESSGWIGQLKRQVIG